MLPSRVEANDRELAEGSDQERRKVPLLEKAEIPTEFRDGIRFVSTRDGIGDGKKH